MIKITVVGLDQIINNINRIAEGLPRESSTVVNEVANELANEMRSRAHVVTGAMKASIRVGFSGTNAASVSVGVPYASYENRRGGVKMGYGPHNFADQALQTVQANAPNKIKLHFDEFFQVR